MKLPDNVTVSVGGKKYKGEIPDGILPAKTEKKLTKQLKGEDVSESTENI